MASNKADALSGLLSGVGGIDGSLFRKPQAMKEMRPGSGQKQPEQIPAMAAKPQQPAAQPVIPSRPSMPQSNFAPSVPSGTARPPAPAARQPAVVTGSRPDSGATSRASSVSSQREVDSAYEQSLLDAFSAKGAVTNRLKAMRPIQGTASAKGMETSSISESRLRPASGNAAPNSRPADQSAGLGDDLDSFFGSSAVPSRPSPQSSSSHHGNHQASTMRDPFSAAILPPTSRQQPTANGDPFLAGSPPPTSRLGPSAAAQNPPSNSYDDDFLGAFSNPGAPSAKGSVPPAGANAAQPSAASPMAVEDEFMIGWSNGPSSQRQKQQQPRGMAAASAGDPFDLFGDAGAIPVAPAAQPSSLYGSAGENPAPPAPPQLQYTARSGTSSQPSSPIPSRVASPAPAPTRPQVDRAPPDAAHLQAASPPPSYDEVIRPPTQQRQAPHASENGLDRLSPLGGNASAHSGPDAGEHPNLPKGPTAPAKPSAAGGAFWASPTSPPREAEEAAVSPRTQVQEGEASNRQTPPRSQTASPRSSQQATTQAQNPRRKLQPKDEGVWEGQVEIEEGSKWLASGKSWLSKASKRVAAAAKESATVIQARLEEIDPRFAPKGWTGARDRMPSNDGTSSNDIPPHLYEIACNMAELSPDRQAALMAAMTEEERLLVQRAMDEAAIARSQLEAEFKDSQAARPPDRASLGRKAASTQPNQAASSDAPPQRPTHRPPRRSRSETGLAPSQHLPSGPASTAGADPSRLSNEGSGDRDYFSDGDAPPPSHTRTSSLGRSKSKDLTRRVSFGADQILGPQELSSAAQPPHPQPAQAPRRPPPPPPSARTPPSKAVDQSADFLGFGGASSDQPRARPQAAPSTTSAPQSADFLGFDDSPASSLSKHKPDQPTARPQAAPSTAAAPQSADFLGFDDSSAAFPPQRNPDASSTASPAPRITIPSPSSPSPSAAPSKHSQAQGSDILGLDDLVGKRPGGTGTMKTPAPAAPAELDLMGLHSASSPQRRIGRPVAPAAASADADLLGHPPGDEFAAMFESPAPGASSAAAASVHVHVTASGQRVEASWLAGADHQLDKIVDTTDDEAAAKARHKVASVSDVDVAGEPEARRVARARRLAEQQRRIAEQVASQQAAAVAEAAAKEQRGSIRDQLKPRIEQWQAGKKDNIRALLSTLHTVLWEGSGWTPPGLTDLVELNRVKKSYMKANLIIHPDKVQSRGGTAEQIVIADMAFDALKTAWAKFESGELRSSGAPARGGPVVM
ncbi:hypothetical protein WJX74_003588 [Apatococcus lobatus]|uniref:J domain-containing protein n=1 Tax=Apatococcus lobatus TaxID=904363 RepID=A0AAW1RSL2_9CHLO